jgi:hypothetical protein
LDKLGVVALGSSGRTPETINGCRSRRVVPTGVVRMPAKDFVLTLVVLEESEWNTQKLGELNGLSLGILAEDVVVGMYCEEIRRTNFHTSYTGETLPGFCQL